MIINRHKIKAATKLYKATLMKAYGETAAPVIGPFISVEEVEELDVTNIGAAMDVKIRKWEGERQFLNVENFSHDATLEPYENSFEIPKEDFIRKNKWMGYKKIPAKQGKAAKEHPYRLAAAVLEGQLSPLGYDGLPLAATTHKIGSTSYNNAWTEVPNRTNFFSARDYLKRIKNKHGKKLGQTPAYIVTSDVGAAHDAAENVFVKEWSLEGNIYVPNQDKNKLQHIAMPDIQSETFWAVICKSSDETVIVYVDEAGPNLVGRTDETLDNVFLWKKYQYGVDLYTVATAGAWYTGVFSTGLGS